MRQVWEANGPERRPGAGGVCVSVCLRLAWACDNSRSHCTTHKSGPRRSAAVCGGVCMRRLRLLDSKTGLMCMVSSATEVLLARVGKTANVCKGRVYASPGEMLSAGGTRVWGFEGEAKGVMMSSSCDKLGRPGHPQPLAPQHEPCVGCWLAALQQLGFGTGSETQLQVAGDGDKELSVAHASAWGCGYPCCMCGKRTDKCSWQPLACTVCIATCNGVQWWVQPLSHRLHMHIQVHVAGWQAQQSTGVTGCCSQPLRWMCCHGNVACMESSCMEWCKHGM